MKKLKGAVLLYGITRDHGEAVSKSFESIILNLFKKNNIECDIYMHAWILGSKISGYVKNEKGLEVKNHDDWQLFKPDFFKTQKQSQFDKSMNYKAYIDNSGLNYGEDNDLKVINYVRALHSLQRCYRMTNNKDYDFFFVSRLDTLFQTAEGLINSISCASKSETPLIHTPCWHGWGGFNDRMCVANSEGAEFYCNRVKYLKNYKKTCHNHARKLDEKWFNGEKFLYNLIKFHEIEHDCYDAVAVRMRHDGSIAPFDRTLVEKIKKKKNKS